MRKIKIKSSFIKDFASYGLVGVLGKAINIFAIPFYVRLLEVSEFGVLDLFSSSLAILTLVSTFQLETSFLRFYSQLETKSDIKKYFSTGLNGVSLLMAPFCLISYFVLYPFFKDFDIRILYGIIALIPVKSLYAYMTCLFRVTFDRELFVKINLINIIGVPALSIFLVYLDYGVLGIVMATLAINLIALLVVILKTKDYYVSKLDKIVLKSMLQYCLPLIPSSFSVTLQQNLMRFVILSFLGVEILGYYAFALKVFIPFALIIQSLKMAWYPRAYQIFDKETNYIEKFKKIEKFYFLIIGVLFIVLMIVSVPAINFVGGDKMEGSTEIVQLIGLIFLLRAASYFYIVIQNIKKTTKLILLINFTSLVFLVLSLFVLVQLDQLTISNVILTEVFTEGCKLVMVYFISKKQLPDSFNYGYSIGIVAILLILSLFI